MTRHERNIRRLGSPSEIAKKVCQFVPRTWLYSDTSAHGVAPWAADSYFSSLWLFGDWVSIAADSAEFHSEILFAVEREIASARTDRAATRRAWARSMATEHGTDEQANQAISGDLSRAEVERIVLDHLGVGLMPQSSPCCHVCGELMARTVERLTDSRFFTALEQVTRSLRAVCGHTYECHAELVLASYRCPQHGIIARHEIEVYVEHIENGWVGRCRLDALGVDSLYRSNE